MATVWVKPHFLEKDGPLENGVFMNICSWGFPDMFIRGGNLCSWANGYRVGRKRDCLEPKR